MDLSYSSFNPGGDEIGLSLDNTQEIASFSSVISSNLLGEMDRHGCNLPASYADGYTYFSQTTCGASAPDSSDYPIYIGNLGPHETQTFTFTITISDSFASVPEPSVLAIFGPMTLGLGLLLRGQPRRSHPE